MGRQLDFTQLTLFEFLSLMYFTQSRSLFEEFLDKLAFSFLSRLLNVLVTVTDVGDSKSEFSSLDFMLTRNG